MGSLEDMWRMEALRCVKELSVVSEKQLVCLAHNMESFTVRALNNVNTAGIRPVGVG